MKKPIQKLLQPVPLEILATALVFLISLFTFSLIVHEAVYEQEYLFDIKVTHFFAAHSSPTVIKAMENITFLGSTSFLLPAYLVLIVWLLYTKQRAYAFDIGVIALSSTAMMFALKEFFKRERPALPIIKDVSGYSFPSGHSLSSFIFCAVLIFLLWKSNLPGVLKYLLMFFCLFLAIIIGISRIVLNVHYPTDVIGGFCLGIIWVIASFAIIQKIRKKNSAAAPGI